MSLKTELLDQIKEDLVRHEGYVTEIYLCSENIPTFGIGHMVTESDMEHTWPVGTPVADERILQVFHDDCMIAVKDAETMLFVFWLTWHLILAAHDFQDLRRCSPPLKQKITKPHHKR